MTPNTVFGQQSSSSNPNPFQKQSGQFPAQSSTGQQGSIFGQSSNIQGYRPQGSVQQLGMQTGQQGGTTGMFQAQQGPVTAQPQLTQQPISLSAPIFSLSPMNSYRFDKIESLQDENAKKFFKDIEKAFKDNSNHLDNINTYFKEIDHYYKNFFIPAGNEAINYSKITISKKGSTDYIIQTLISEIEKEY
jgi:hypothetical protein